MLIACILRVCHEWDLRSPDLEERLDEAVRQQLEYLASGSEFLAEAIIHGASGRIPRRAVLDLSADHDKLGDLAAAVLVSASD